MNAPDYAHPVTGTPLPLWSGTPPDWRVRPEKSDFLPTITPYLLPAETSKGFVVVCFGGGYAHRAPHEGEPVARRFNELGFSAAVVAYRTVTECEKPLRDGVQRDLARAVRIVRAHAAAWGTVPDRIAILGFSAGGNLVGTASVHYDSDAVKADTQRDGFAPVSSRPDATIPCYAVLLGRGPSSHSGTLQNLADGDESWIDFGDVPARVTSDTPPMFLWHTLEDPGVPVENSLRMADALRVHGVPFALHVFTRGHHGIGLAPEDPENAAWPELAARWLEHSVFARKQPS